MMMPAGTPPIDLSLLSELLDHDAEKVSQFAQVFLQSTRDGLSELDAALARGDMVLTRELGHRIKASAQIVGALGMAQLCQDLENLPRPDIKADIAMEATLAGAIIGQLYALLTQAGELIMLHAGRDGR
jgi:HPt (histidine-containing phosphotransfer) domain-containing protein